MNSNKKIFKKKGIKYSLIISFIASLFIIFLLIIKTENIFSSIISHYFYRLTYKQPKNIDKRTINTSTPTPKLLFDIKEIEKDINIILNENRVPEFNIDTQEWIYYYDENSHMSFKYPEQWGVPTSKIITNNSPNSSGSSYSLHFSLNSSIRIDGVSEDFGLPRGFHSFAGFIERNERGRTPDEFCEYQKGAFLYCIKKDNAVLALTGKESCYYETWFYEPYNLNYYADFPDEYLIDGVQLSTDFLSKKYRDLVNKYTCGEIVDNYRDNSSEFYKAINQALLDRRLDKETMRSYDILRKFYESIVIH